MTAPKSAEHRLEHWVHYSLLVGLALSGFLLVGGLAAAWLWPPSGAVPHDPSARQALRHAWSGEPVAITALGIMALMATPLMRVLVLAVGWAIDRDWRFAAVAMAVLSLLGVSLALGMG